MLDKKVVEEYNRTGFVVVKGLVSDFIETITSDIENFLSQGHTGEDFYYEDSIDNKRSMLRRIERCLNYIDISSTDKTMEEAIASLTGYRPALFKDKLNLKYAGSNKFAYHLDGHFLWKHGDDQKNGWEEYAGSYINAVIPLDGMHEENGCLLVAEKQDTLKIFGSYEVEAIVGKLPNSSLPYISEKDNDKVRFKPLIMEPGDVAFFDWKCIHGSHDNESSTNRKVLYLTYNNREEGCNREKYYADKELSASDRNNKSLN